MVLASRRESAPASAIAHESPRQRAEGEREAYRRIVVEQIELFE
jgi:hypothetical protein